MGESKRRKQIDPSYGKPKEFSITQWLREDNDRHYPLFLKSLSLSLELKKHNIQDIININTATCINIHNEIPEIRNRSGKPLSSAVVDALGKSNPVSDVLHILENQKLNHQTFLLSYQGKAYFLTWTMLQVNKLIETIASSISSTRIK